MSEYNVSLNRERKLLQRTVAVLGLIPVGAGLTGALIGPTMVDATVAVSADSHYRYLSGLLFGIGLCFWSTIPAIEERTGRFRLLTLIVFIGGLGRLFGLLLTGVPSIAMLGGLIMELVVTPVLCLWQARVASKCEAAHKASEAATRTVPEIPPPPSNSA